MPLAGCSCRGSDRASWSDKISACVLRSGGDADCAPKLGGAAGYGLLLGNISGWDLWLGGGQLYSSIE